MSSYPTELDARLKAAEILGQEMNIQLKKTESKMEALETADQGKHFKFAHISVPCIYNDT